MNLKLFVTFSLFFAIISTSCKNNNSIQGCTDTNACNFDNSVEEDDGSCFFICLSDSQKTRVIDFVNAAVSYIQEQGVPEAYSGLSAPNPLPQFIDNELYIFVLDISNKDNEEAIMVAHGFREEDIGLNRYNTQDITGKYAVHDFIELTNQSPTTWAWYFWEDPTDLVIKKKFSYIVKLENLLIGAGTFVD